MNQATIWKFPIETTDRQVIEMPEGARILTVQVQHGQPCLWALVDPSRSLEWRNVYVVGTGHDADHVRDRLYIGTYQLMAGRLIFHVWV